MDELNNISPKLSKIPRGTPFQVPGGYFETFSDRLDETIHKKVPAPDRRIHYLKPYLAAAILIIVALVSGNYILRNTLGRSGDRFHAEVSRVVEQELYSISEETILETLETDVAPETETSAETDELINYLLDENIDEADMLNDL